MQSNSISGRTFETTTGLPLKMSDLFKINYHVKGVKRFMFCNFHLIFENIYF